jgi:hypothetical protein
VIPSTGFAENCTEPCADARRDWSQDEFKVRASAGDLRGKRHMIPTATIGSLRGDE